MKKWAVKVRKKIVRGLWKLPEDVLDKALALTADLRYHGYNPGEGWLNFSHLEGDKYHCHLNYSYVACWEVVDETKRLMEVYYVGSREDAPY